jgi:outer membrane biosynthesis protein TonB
MRRVPLRLEFAERAAAEALKQWKYRPFQPNGQAADVQSMVRINFTLER